MQDYKSLIKSDILPLDIMCEVFSYTSPPYSIKIKKYYKNLNITNIMSVCHNWCNIFKYYVIYTFKKINIDDYDIFYDYALVIFSRQINYNYNKYRIKLCKLHEFNHYIDQTTNYLLPALKFHLHGIINCTYNNKTVKFGFIINKLASIVLINNNKLTVYMFNYNYTYSYDEIDDIVIEVRRGSFNKTSDFTDYGSAKIKDLCFDYYTLHRLIRKYRLFN